MSSTYDNTVFDFDLDFLNQPPPNNAEPEPEPEPEPDLQAKCDRLRKSVIYFKKRVKVIDHYVTVAKAAKNEIAELRISEKKLKNQCKQHHVEIGNFIEKVTRLENDLQASVDRERQKSETISELENEIVATQNIYAQYKVLVEEHRLEPSRNKKGKAGVVNNTQKTSIEKEVETLRKNNAKFLNLDKVNEKLRKENARIPNLEKEIEDLRKNNISDKINDHTEIARIKQLENEIEVLQKQNAEIPKLEREMANLQKENTKISKLEKEVEYLQKENAKIPKLIKEIENLHKENVKLTKLGNEKETLSKLNIKISNLEKDYEILCIKHAAIETENKAFRKKIDRITSKAEDRITNLNAATKENGKLRTKHNKLARKYKSLPDRQSGRSDDSEAEYDVFENPVLSPIPNDIIRKTSLIAGKDTAVPCEFDTENSPEYLLYSPSNRENIENEEKPEDTAMSGSPILLKETETPTIIVVDHNENQSVCELKSVETLLREREHRKSHSSNDEREASNSVTDTSDNVRPKKRTQEKECLEINKSISHRKTHSSNDEREASNSVTDTSDNVRPKKRTQEKECLEINKSISHRKTHSSNDEREASNSVTDTSDNVRPKKHTQEKECLEINKSISHRKTHSSNDEREASNSVTDTSDNVRPKKRTQEKECLEINTSISHRKSHSSNDEREASNSVTDTSDNVRPKKRTQEKECLEIYKSISHRKTHSSNDEREASNSVTDTSDNVRPKKRTQEKQCLEINKRVSHRKTHSSNDEREASNSVTDTSDNVRPKKRTQEKECREINKSVSRRKSYSNNDERELSKCVDTSENVRPIKLSQEKECLEINNSLRCESHTELELENIFSTMKLNYNAISPIPKTPINLDPTPSPSEKFDRCSSLCYKTIDFMQTLIKMAVSQGRDRYKVNINDCDKMIACFESILKAEQFLTETYPEHSVLNTNSNMELSDCVLGRDGNNLGTRSNPEPSTTSSQKETDIPQHKNCQKRLSQNASLLEEENQNQLLYNDETSITISNPSSPDKVTNMNRDKQVENGLLQCLPMSLDENQLINHSVSEELATENGMSKATDSDGSSHDIVEVDQPPIIKKKKKSKKKTKLEKLKKKLEPKYKIRMEMTHPEKMRVKPKQIVPIKRKVTENDTSASLNRKEIYEKAVNFMAQLNSQQSAKQAETTPKHTNDINKPPRHAACVEKNIENSSDNQVLHNCAISTRSKRKFSELFEPLLPPRKSENSTTHKATEDDNSSTHRSKADNSSIIHRAKEDNIINNCCTTVTHKVIEDIESSNELPLRKRLRRYSDKPLNLFSMNAKKDKNSATDRSKQDNISTTHKVKEDTVLSSELPLRKRLRQSSDKPLNISLSNAKENSNSTSDIATKDNNSATNRAKEDIISTPQKLKEDIEPSNELPLRKRLRSSSNEPLIQYKRVLRSATVHTKLCTEVNNELSKLKGKSSWKSIKGAGRNESATQINDESTSHNSNVVSYVDLDLFSEDIQLERKMSETLRHSSDKPLNIISMNTKEDNNSTTNRATEGIIPSNELPLQKGRRRSSNEPLIQSKRILRSSVNTKLCTEDNIELTKSKGKSSKKSMVPTENKSATRISNESTLNNNNIVSYKDLDLFSEDIQLEKIISEMLGHLADKPLNINSMNTEEYIKPSDELAFEKGRRRSSNEPLKQYKAVFRSATLHTKLCTEDNELSNSKGKNSTKSITDPTENESVTQINNESTLLYNSDVVCSEDLEDFSDNLKNKMMAFEIEKNTDKSDCSPKDSILCHMIVKYGMETATRIEKRIPVKVVTKICGKIERGITIIIQNHCNQKAKDNLVADLGKLNYKYFIAGLMQFLAKPERKLELFGKVSGYPAPAMTKTEQILLDIIAQLKKYWPSVDVVDAVLSNIEFTLFKLNRTPDFDVIESVSHFYAVLCRFVKAQSRLRLFILDAMYCIQFKSVPLIKQCLEVWMSLIPLAHMGIAKSPMVTCLVYLLHFYKCDDRYNRVQELRKILRDQYFYKITNWSETKILEMFKNSITGLRDIAIEKKMLRLALIILAKRRGPRWCQLHIVNNLLGPIIQKKNVPNNVKHFCVSLIGPLMKPYPADMKIYCEIAINQLLDILDNNPPPELEEAAITSMMVINRHNQHSLNKMLLSRKMKPMSLTLEKRIRDYVKTRPFKVWEMHLSTIALELETYCY